MSVFLIASSFVTTLLIPPAAFEEGGEANGRALAYLAHELPRRRLRHGLRRQHDPDPLVRRRLGDGRPAEHRAALPAALRHGPGLGARRPAAGAGLHGDRLRRHDHLPGRRRRPGRRLRHRRAGADDLGGGRRDALGPAAAAARRATVAFGVDRAGLRLHDGRQRRRAARRREDRAASSSSRSSSSRSSRGSGARPSCASTEVELDETAERFIDEAAGAASSASSPTTRTSATSREYLLKEREEREDNHIPPGDPVLFLEVTVRDASEFAPVLHGRGRGDRRLPGAAGRGRRRSPTRSPPSCCTCATRPASGRTPTSTGPRATRCSTWPASSSSARATSRR